MILCDTHTSEHRRILLRWQHIQQIIFFVFIFTFSSSLQHVSRLPYKGCAQIVEISTFMNSWNLEVETYASCLLSIDTGLIAIR